jgi:hypothetical protein
VYKSSLYLALFSAFGCVACSTCNPDSTGDNNAGGAAVSGAQMGGLNTTNGNALAGTGVGANGGGSASQAGLGGQNSSSGGGGTSGKVVSQGSGGSGKSGQAGASAAGKGNSGSGATTGGAGSSATKLPTVTSVDTAGPFKTTQKLTAAGPSSTSALFYPTELGKDGLKHPVFIWGCGGTTNPSTYADLLNKIASHGFVVVGEVEEIGDSGAPLTACIDWVVSESKRSDSIFYQKLDTDKIAVGGHSIGSANTFFIAADPRLTTTIHIAGGSLDNVNDPYAATTGKGGKGLIHPVAYICSESDMFGNVEKTEKDYANTTVPAFMTIMSGTEHMGAASAGLPVMIGWLRWHLGGETERRDMFLDPAGQFCTGIFVSKNKNW